jgi:hypothetical protein
MEQTMHGGQRIEARIPGQPSLPLKVAHMRARIPKLSTICVAGLVALSPSLVYEGLQKGNECLGLRGTMWEISAQAERMTPWRPETGSTLVDHTIHELRETRTFFHLAGRSLGRQFLGERNSVKRA